MTFFWCRFGFGKGFGASRSSHWADHCQLLCKIHFSSHVTIWLRNGLLLLHRMKEDNTSKHWFFWFSVNSWGSHLLSFFNFLICSRWQMTMKWLILSSLATSYTVVKRISFDDPRSLSASNSQPLHFSSSNLLCKTPWTTTALSISSCWAKCIADVASCLHCFMTHFDLE